MLISRIVQPDAQSIEFANRQAASAISDTPGGRSFEDYLAVGRTDRPEEARPPDHSPGDASSRDAARSTQAESDDNARVRAKDTRRDEERAERESSPRSERDGEPKSVREETSKSEETGSEDHAKHSDATVVADRSTKTALRGGRTAAVSGPQDESTGARRTAETGKASKAAHASLGDISPRDATALSLTAPKAETTRRGTRATENVKEIVVRVPASNGASMETSSKASAVDSAHATAEEKTKEPAGAEDHGPVEGRSAGDRKRAARVSSEARGDEALRAGADVAAAAESREADAGRERARVGGRADDRSERESRQIEVRDLRSSRGERGARGGDGDAAADRHAGEKGGEAQFRPATGESGSASPASRADESGAFENLRSEALSQNARPGMSASRAIAQTAEGLSRALRENVNAEIVRSARLIVRGNDSGEIRLHLKPEQLGSVRIALQMHEGHIAGRIVVENQSVREVFEQNLAALQRAFEESGLEAGGLEVTLADYGDQSGETDDGSPDRGGRVRGRAGAMESLDAAVPAAEWFDEEHDLVDVVV